MDQLRINIKELVEKEMTKKLYSTQALWILKQWRSRRFLRRHQVRILWMTLIETTIFTRKLKLRWTFKTRATLRSLTSTSSFVEFIVLSSILSCLWEPSTWKASNRILLSLLLCRLFLMKSGIRSVDSLEFSSSMVLHCWLKFWKKQKLRKPIKLLS
jgi:hypothetical protein